MIRTSFFRPALWARLVFFAGLASGLALPALALDPNLCDAPGEAPDVVGGLITGAVRWGSIGNITAYSFGADGCNLGTCRMKWTGANAGHPIIAQNMFRLKNGRFEQLGQSWVKHVFAADQNQTCSSACIPTASDTLGVNCSDLYTAGTNGLQGRLGPKGEIDPHMGTFPYPATDMNKSGNSIYKRLQIHTLDIEPSLNQGASYWVEAQYIAEDDAAGGNDWNNCSYRPVSFVPSPTGINAVLIGTTTVGAPAIHAWKLADPSVVETQIPISGFGTYILSAKATAMPDGRWSYEYALYNQSSILTASAFRVPAPPGTSFDQIGFHDVDFHSGELQDTRDWVPTVSDGQDLLSWDVRTDLDSSTRANVMIWGTVYNFRFVADAAPGTHPITISFGNPTVPPATPPESWTVATLTPSRCDADGSCDPGESCASCPADCQGQGGGGGCCGNGACEAGETGTACREDCAAALAGEIDCGNGFDDDRDGATDCMDPECCTSAACTMFDTDADSYGICDCSPNDTSVWALPPEVPELVVSGWGGGTTNLTWAPVGGAIAVTYDLLRSASPADFSNAAICFDHGNPGSLSAQDPELPHAATMFAYLVRGIDACGVGSPGVTSSGAPRQVRTCP